MKRHLPLFLLLSLFLLVACGQLTKTLQVQATIQLTATQDSRTATATEGIRIGISVIPPATWSPTPTAPTKMPKPTRTPVPTLTPFPPFATKQVLLDYYNSGFHTVYDFVLDYTFSNLVLYSDGQMIVVGETYKQKEMSVDERNQFLSKLVALGLYRIVSNQKHDPSDQLYNFGDQYSRIYDDINNCVLVKGDRPRSLCAYEHFKEFLVPEMKNVLEFLENYPTEGMTLYYPDRILLWVQVGRNPYDNNLPEKAIDWPKNLPSLVTKNQKIMFTDGKTAKDIYSLLNKKTAGVVFKDNDIEYTVYQKIVLPHEEMKNEGQ